MALITIPLIGSGTQSQGVQLNPSQLINLYITNSLGIDRAKSKEAAVRTPGTSIKYTIPNLGLFRGQIVFDNILYVVYTTSFYSITTGGVITLLNSGVPITAGSGRVSLVSNGISILIDDGTTAWNYVFSGGAFAEMTDADFTSTGFLTYTKSRALYAKTTDNTVWAGALNDFTTWSALSFSSMESVAQNLVCAFATPSHLFVFGPVNTEVWSPTSDVNFPFSPIPGVNIPYGCAARDSICYINGTLIFLAKNAQGKGLLLTLSSSFEPQMLLDEAGISKLQALDTISDAKAATFELHGHIFYAITFPTEEVSFLYDTQTQKFTQWISWADGGTDIEGNTIWVLGRHLFDDIFVFNNEILIADYRSNGLILKLDPEVYVDYATGEANSIYFELISPNITAQGARVTVNSLEIDHEKGLSIYSEEDLTQNPTLNQPLFNVALSKDGGRTFTYSRSVNFGFSGDYTTRARLNCWGDFRNGALKISGDHPSFIGLYNVWANIDIENESIKSIK